VMKNNSLDVSSVARVAIRDCFIFHRNTTGSIALFVNDNDRLLKNDNEIKTRIIDEEMKETKTKKNL